MRNSKLSWMTISKAKGEGDMSIKKNEKMKNNSYVIPGILFMITIIAVLVSYGSRMINDAKKQVENDYKTEVDQVCSIYEKNIYAVEKSINLIANTLFEEGNLFSDDCINYIDTAAHTLGIKNIYLVKPDYSAMDRKGNTYENIIDNPVFEKVFNSKNSKNAFVQDDKEKEALYIIKDIMDNNTHKGYVIAEYVPNVMETLLNNPKFSSRKTFALISSTGDVIEVTGKTSYTCEVDGNMLEKAKELEYHGSSYNAFAQAIADCRSGSQNTSLTIKGESKYLYYAPIEGCKALVLMLVDAKDVSMSYASVSKNIRQMLIGIGISIVAFAMILVIVGIYSKAKHNIESESLQNKADTDLLTDLYNKIATERMIKEYLSGEGKEHVSMLFVLDVDDFKKINDTRGHAFGDQVLSQLGHEIRAWFRVNDIVGRIGGDEFMIFIKDVKDPEVIKREGSRIMQFFEGFNVGEYTKYSPTASVGGAVYPNDADDFESLYKAADKAVYKSKKEGKNRVSFYSDLNTIERDTEVKKEEND